MTGRIRLAASFVTVGGWTLASRVLGFVRDILIAAFLGAGPVAEAFLVAFALPNMFRRFFAEGAFNMAFVPMFARRLEGGEDARGFAADAYGALAAILVALTLVAQVLMPWLVLAMAGGFAGDARLELATLFGRIAFPYILFISLAALVSGVLNSIGRFAAAAAAPVLLNVLFIAALVGARLTGFDAGLALALAVPVAGAAQLCLVHVAAARAGFPIRPRWPRLTPELRRLAVIAAPAALAGGVVQVNLLVGRQVASFFDGAIAWLGYADRLYQLPLGVVGIAMGVVLLPDLSRRLRAGDTDGGRAAFNRAAEISLALTVPAALVFIAVPVPLVSVLFERGAFGPEDTRATAVALAVYGAGLPAFVLQKVLQPLFFAREDTRTPFRYALWTLLANAVVAIGLAPVLGYVAAALGTTVSGWAMVWMLYRGSRPMGEPARIDGRLAGRFWRILAASALTAAVAWAAAQGLSDALSAPGLRYWALGALVLGGLLLYAAAGQALGAFRIAELRRSLSRR